MKLNLSYKIIFKCSWNFLQGANLSDIKEKMKLDGSINKYKARVVIKGYKQQKGFDDFDIYSSVTRINYIRMILAITTLCNLEVLKQILKNLFKRGLR